MAVHLVLVSHNRKLADGLLELVRQVAPEPVRVAVVAGIGDDHSEMGTDAVAIAETILELDSGDGVLVLMDLGSAILSAETALDMLDADTRGRVCLSAAPLVEGAIAAAVEAGLGSDLQKVRHSAEQGLRPKQEHLGDAPVSSVSVRDGSGLNSIVEPSFEAVARVNNPHGLHLRPAAVFVETAGRFQAEIEIWNLNTGAGPVPATSIVEMMVLGVDQGHLIKIRAVGKDAAEAIRALSRLAEEN